MEKRRRHVKSKTDVITNSSSEIFIFRNYGKSAEEILKDLKSIDDGHSSGMGGLLKVYDKDSKRRDCGFSWNYKWLLPGWSLLDIDEAKKDVIEYFLKNYWVVDCDYFYVKDKETGRLLRKPTVEEYEEMKSNNVRCYDIADHMESWSSMVKLRESLKDEKNFLRNIKRRWKREKDRLDSKKNGKDGYYSRYKWLVSKYGTPNGELEEQKRFCKDWFERHPLPPDETYRYDINEPMD